MLLASPGLQGTVDADILPLMYLQWHVQAQGSVAKAMPTLPRRAVNSYRSCCCQTLITPFRPSQRERESESEREREREREGEGERERERERE